MAGNIKDVLVTNNPFSYYANGVTDAVNERTVIASTDILATKTSKGTKFNIHPKFKSNPNYLRYVGDWNVSSSYDPNDVVSVFDDKEGDDTSKTGRERIKDQFNMFFKGGVTSERLLEEYGYGKEDFIAYGGLYESPSSGVQFTINIPVPLKPPVAGTYVCVFPIPSLTFTMEAYANSIITNQFFDPRNPVMFQYLVDNAVNYFPRWPELNIVPEPNLQVPSKARGCYWRYLGSYGGNGDGCTCRYS